MPAAQFVQLVDPVLAWKLPAEHKVHVDNEFPPAVAKNVPAGQLVHTEAPADE